MPSQWWKSPLGSAVTHAEISRMKQYLTLCLICTLQLASSHLAASDKGYQPVLSSSEIIALLPAKDLTRAKLTLTDGSEISGYIQPTNAGVRFQRRTRDTETKTYRSSDIKQVTLNTVSHPVLRKAIAAMKIQDFAGAKTSWGR